MFSISSERTECLGRRNVHKVKSPPSEGRVGPADLRSCLSPVVLVHADALSSGDQLLHLGHAVVLPGDLSIRVLYQSFDEEGVKSGSRTAQISQCSGFQFVLDQYLLKNYSAKLFQVVKLYFSEL